LLNTNLRRRVFMFSLLPFQALGIIPTL